MVASHGQTSTSDAALTAVLDGTTGLGRFFDTNSLDALVDAIIERNGLNTPTPTGASSAIDRLVRRLVVDVTRGGRSMDDILTEVERELAGLSQDERVVAEATLSRTLCVVGSRRIAGSGILGPSEPIDEVLGVADGLLADSAPTRNRPGLSSVQVYPVGLSPCGRNTAALSVFFNAVPAIHMSRAVPLLEVSLRTKRAPISVDGRLNSPTLLKFTMGGVAPASATDRSMAEAALDGSFDIFTQPQLLVPEASNGRPADPLDPFSPVVSIRQFSVNVAPTTGFMSFKTARLGLTVHDRARLSELADLVKPDLFGGADIVVEYGWHVNQVGDVADDPWGVLLNAMRVREVYAVVNSSFTLGADGEIQIDVELAMRGSTEYQTTSIGSDVNVQRTAEYVESLQRRIADLHDKLTTRTKRAGGSSRSILGSQLLDVARSTNGSPMLDPKLRRKLDVVVQRLRSTGNDDARELADTLRELYGTRTSSQGSATARLRSSIASVVNRRLAAIDDATRGGLVDPYLTTGFEALPVDDRRTALPTMSRYVSFGKVVMLFVGLPLASTLRFDDVQVIFYTFNDGAGAARNKSIAGFLIDKATLRSELLEHFVTRRGSNMSISDVMSFLTTTFLDNTASLSYGLSSIYERDPEGKLRPNTARYRGRDVDVRAATDAEQRLIKLGVPNGVFVQPQVKLYIEAVPMLGSEDGVVLRVHVFDAAATMYETHGQLIAAARDDSLRVVSFDAAVDPDDLGTHRLRANTYIAAAEAAGLLEGVPGTEVTDLVGSQDRPIYTQYRIVGGPAALKEFVRSTVPNVIFGAQATNVKNMSIQTMTQPALSTVNMLRSDRAGSVTPEGYGRGGVPLKTVPAELSMTTMGCPIVSFGQQLFVDAGTETDLDNIYAVTGIDHEITPGSFNTTVKAVPLQAYGRYESLVNKTEEAVAALVDAVRGAEVGD